MDEERVRLKYDDLNCKVRKDDECETSSKLNAWFVYVCLLFIELFICWLLDLLICVSFDLFNRFIVYLWLLIFMFWNSHPSTQCNTLGVASPALQRAMRIAIPKFTIAEIQHNNASGCPLLRLRPWRGVAMSKFITWSLSAMTRYQPKAYGYGW